jgi:hypothetical protein
MHTSFPCLCLEDESVVRGTLTKLTGSSAFKRLIDQHTHTLLQVVASLKVVRGHGLVAVQEGDRHKKLLCELSAGSVARGVRLMSAVRDLHKSTIS